MGADLIMSVLAEPADPNVKLNWAAGDELIDATVDPAVLEEWFTSLDECGGLEDVELDDDLQPNHAQLKEAVKAIFTKLKEEVINPDGFPARDVTTLQVRDLWLTISGGMSWGDSPTEACEYMDAAGYFPEILKEIGFVLDWDQVPA